MGSCVLPDRAVLGVMGAEAGAFLDHLITVNVSGLPLHGARFGALLTRKENHHRFFCCPD